MADKKGSYQTAQKDGWKLREYADLTEQWSTTKGSRHHMYLEKHDVCSEGYRVVTRKPPPSHSDTKCPPVISGPHDTLEAGKAAYLMALATL